MEQKRTLWIIAAAGVFLLVVIGAALILYSPARSPDPAIASLQVQNDMWSLPPVALPPVTVPEPSKDISSSAAAGGAAALPKNVDELTVISGTTTVYGTGSTVIDLNSLKPATSTQSPAVTPMNQAAVDAVSAAGSNSSIAGSNSAAGTRTTDVAGSKTLPAATEKKTVTQPSAAVKTAPATEKKAAVPEKLSDQYWVQVASFASKKNAEDARAALLDNKIGSEIFTYTDSANKMYYRLRVGPYTTKTEAEYWRSRIILIDEFANNQSYVTNSTAAKSK